MPVTTWHALTIDDTAHRLGVDPARGLDAADAARRLAESGPNELASKPPPPAWKLFVEQFRSVLILVLLGAAGLAAAVGDVKDAIVIAIVVVLNASLGFFQEFRAAKSLDALKAMITTTARVRRDGMLAEVPTADLVPGDIVVVEAGDQIPADGRLSVANRLAVAEAALTGESTPVDKAAEVTIDADAALGDRTNAVFLQTTVTRGRGEFVVTATGAQTELGRLAGMLEDAEPGETPLQRQLHVLGLRLAAVAGVAVAIVFGIGLAQGTPLGELIASSIALAVAAVPEGLPAVVTVTLSIGMYKMAKQRAIVRRLASVETLGATDVICSDKTGTLTRNLMVARDLWLDGRRAEIGDRIVAVGDRPADEIAADVTDPDAALPGLDAAVVAMVCCNEAELRNGELVGDPTEGALLQLAAAADADVAAIRSRWRRVGEIPFDSSTKYMATFDADPDAPGSVRVHVKGAADVLATLASGTSPTARDAISAEVDRLAGKGRRVLAIATATVPADTLPATGGEDAADELLRLLSSVGLRIVALVGIIDPPRPEAAAAIARCAAAGIAVKMITGDHVTTAAAIAADLGIQGRAVTGADLDRTSDDDLIATVHDIGVFARVSPEHKMRIVKALQANGDVAAMTGDGVNDAPALEVADIGVAMGITGTEVTKAAADMVLTDDDFTTIVAAVEGGRTIYDNIVKFVRFQLSTNIGAIATVVAGPLLGIPLAFAPLQLLWVNLICDGPPAMALGVDPARPGVMDEPPRPSDAQILSAGRLARLAWFGLIMAVGTLAVYAVAAGGGADAAVAQTMAFTTFVWFQLFNAFNARTTDRSAFGRQMLSNTKLLAALGAIAVLQVVAVEVPFAQDLFDTTGMSLTQWAVSIAVASSVLWCEEVRKIVWRLVRPKRADAATAVGTA